MKNLTPAQYVEILKFVQDHHAFAKVIDLDKRKQRKIEFPHLPDSHGFGLKYVDSVYDSRGGTIWSISFRHGSWGVCFKSNHYITGVNPEPKDWKYNSLYDLCMAYLKGEFKPKEEFFIEV